jgi:TolA-binding protein
MLGSTNLKRRFSLMKRNVVWVAAAASLVLGAHPGAAQPSEELKDLRKEVDTLKEGQSAIQKDLQEIKGLLRARPAAPGAVAPQDIVLDLDGAPIKGAKTAKITLVEFTDYQ